jgi:hypothetical protein
MCLLFAAFFTHASIDPLIRFVRSSRPVPLNINYSVEGLGFGVPAEDFARARSDLFRLDGGQKEKG